MGGEIPASTEQSHYLGTVLRRESGAAVRLFNGADGEWRAEVRFDGRGRAGFVAADQIRAQAEEPGPWLLFAVLKRDATDLVVRQAVELGVSRIRPVLTARTNAARVNESRLRAIAIEAAEQCERLTLPALDPLARLDSVLAAWPADRGLFAALERSGDRASAARAGGADTALLTGPEGGFTDSERDRLCRLPFVTPMSLGPRVLRAETAVVAGLALLLAGG
jgi:16S rRNA (uracil1498-N3)-methyltransferase